MLEILNVNCKEDGWRIDKNKQFDAFWINMDGKDLYVPIEKNSSEDFSKVDEKILVNKSKVLLNQFDATKNAKGITMVRSNKNASWDKSLLIAFKTPNGEEITNIEVKDDSNCLLDVLYFHSSNDKTKVAMVVSVPSFISVKNIARDNSIVIHYGKVENGNNHAQIILPYYLDNEKCLTRNFDTTIKALKKAKKMEYVRTFRQKVLIVPDKINYEEICKIKEERNLQFVKALHYSEVDKYIRENKYQLYDILFLKDTDYSEEEGKAIYMNMINTISTAITESSKNARMYVARDNNRYVMWRLK